MRILETTTCVMACFAACADSPRRAPCSSVTGMPALSSLESKAHAYRSTGASLGRLERSGPHGPHVTWSPTRVSLWAQTSLFSHPMYRFNPHGTGTEVRQHSNFVKKKGGGGGWANSNFN